MRASVLIFLPLVPLLLVPQALSGQKKLLFHYEGENLVESADQEKRNEDNFVSKQIPYGDAISDANQATMEDGTGSLESEEKDYQMRHVAALNLDQLSLDFSQAFKTWIESPSPTLTSNDSLTTELSNKLPACSEEKNRGSRNISLRGRSQINNSIFVGTRSQFDKTGKASFLVEINEDGSYQNPWLLATLQRLGLSCYPTLIILEGTKVAGKFEGLSQILSSELGKISKVKSK